MFKSLTHLPPDQSPRLYYADFYKHRPWIGGDVYIHQRRPPPSSSSKVTSHQRLIFSHAVFSPMYKSTLRNYSSSGKHALNSSSIHCNSATTQRARFIYSLRVPGRVKRSRKPLWGAPDNLRGLSCSFYFFWRPDTLHFSSLWRVRNVKWRRSKGRAAVSSRPPTHRFFLLYASWDILSAPDLDTSWK